MPHSMTSYRQSSFKPSPAVCRIPLATSHPQLPVWVGNKPHLLLLNRVDMISEEDQAVWAAYFRSRNQTAYWTDGKQGTGVRKVICLQHCSDHDAQLLPIAAAFIKRAACPQVAKAAVEVGGGINEARKRRGLLPRAVKAAVVHPHLLRQFRLGPSCTRVVCVLCMCQSTVPASPGDDHPAPAQRGHQRPIEISC